MGRYYSDKKTEADNLNKIDITWLKKHGYLDAGIWSKPGGIEWMSGFSGTKSSIGICSRTVTFAGKAPGIDIGYTSTDGRTGLKKDLKYTVSLVASSCTYGGERWWFICPISKNSVNCGRRVGTLYLCGSYFGCRHCHELTYRSKNRNRKSKFGPLMDSLDSIQKAEELENEIKRHFYAGKPTKKHRRMSALYGRMVKVGPLIDLLR